MWLQPRSVSREITQTVTWNQRKVLLLFMVAVLVSTIASMAVSPIAWMVLGITVQSIGIVMSVLAVTILILLGTILTLLWIYLCLWIMCSIIKKIKPDVEVQKIYIIAAIAYSVIIIGSTIVAAVIVIMTLAAQHTVMLRELAYLIFGGYWVFVIWVTWMWSAMLAEFVGWKSAWKGFGVSALAFILSVGLFMVVAAGVSHLLL